MMNRDEVQRLAEEAGLIPSAHGKVCGIHAVERFAAMVAAAEREACAKVCDDQGNDSECPERATYCAAAIRARSAAKEQP